MALILTEKYNYNGSYKTFLINRGLKIFPVYWFTLLATIIFCLLVYYTLGEASLLHHWFGYIENLGFWQIAMISLSNIFILGQDIMLFSVQNNSEVFLSADPFSENMAMHKYLIIPPSWTLAIELYFYIIAPLFIHKSKKVLIFYILTLLVLRVYFSSLGYNYDPWSYRFFPLELVFFLMGVLAYKGYNFLKLIDSSYIYKVGNWGQYIILICLISYSYVPEITLWELDVKKWILYIVLSSMLPFIFFATKRHKLNRAIGELSYPIYLIHMLVLVVLTGCIKLLDFPINDTIITSGIIIICIFISYFINKFTSKYIENYRQKRVKKSKRI